MVLGSGKNLFRIPDPGVKMHPIPDPGSGSATLLAAISSNAPPPFPNLNFCYTIYCSVNLFLNRYQTILQMYQKYQTILKCTKNK